MDGPVIVGIDVGTTKVCTLVAREEGVGNLRILGVGVEPSQGVKKGSVVDMAAATQSIARSVEKVRFNTKTIGWRKGTQLENIRAIRLVKILETCGLFQT